MKVKTSITLSEDLLRAMEQHRTSFKNRSDLIEAALRAFFKQLIVQARNAQDMDIIHRHRHRLNAEALDVLSYQKPLK
jgi:metal-responsive CopG/Arc/MetJ family transcriptional regulator